MPNIDLKCSECGGEFYFSERDQEFYKEKEFSPPKRCWGCRQKRKDARGDVGREAVSTPKVEDFSAAWGEGPPKPDTRRKGRKRPPRGGHRSEDSYD